MWMSEGDSGRGMVSPSCENDTQDIVIISLCIRKPLQNQRPDPIRSTVAICTIIKNFATTCFGQKVCPTEACKAIRASNDIQATRNDHIGLAAV
jgi:hypothetical protein